MEIKMKLIVWLSVSSAVCLAMEQENTNSADLSPPVITSTIVQKNKIITPVLEDIKNGVKLVTEENEITPVGDHLASTKQDVKEDKFLSDSLVQKWIKRLTVIDGSAHSNKNKEYSLKSEDIDHLIFWLQNSYVTPYGSDKAIDKETHLIVQNFVNQLFEKKQRRNEKKECKVKEKNGSAKGYNDIKTNLMKLLGHKNNKSVSKDQFNTQFTQFKNHINDKVKFYAALINFFNENERKEWDVIPILRDLKLYIENATTNSDTSTLEKNVEDETSNLNEVFNQKTREYAKKELQKFKEKLKDHQKEVIENIPLKKYNKWVQRLRFVNY